MVDNFFFVVSILLIIIGIVTSFFWNGSSAMDLFKQNPGRYVLFCLIPVVVIFLVGVIVSFVVCL